jgi:hypothetical protein
VEHSVQDWESIMGKHEGLTPYKTNRPRTHAGLRELQHQVMGVQCGRTNWRIDLSFALTALLPVYAQNERCESSASRALWEP